MFFFRLLSRLPFPVLYLVSDGLFFVTYYLLGYRRKVVRQNLENSFPGKSRYELVAIEKGFYKNLCDYAVETLKLLTISKEALKRRMVFKNPEEIQRCKDRGQSSLYLASHQFNWEWIIAAADLWLPVRVDYVYQPQSSGFVNRFSFYTRGRFGSGAIKRADVVREMVKRRGTVCGVAIVADQFPGHGNDKKYWGRFLGQDTAFFDGVNNLAVMMQYPVFFIKIDKVKRGHYEMEFVQIGTPPFEKGSHGVIEAYIKATEEVVRANPTGWLWSHRRWKQRKPET